MAEEIVIWRDMGLLSAGLGDAGPCPDDLRMALTPTMRYTFKEALRGFDRRDPQTGELRKFRFEDRKLYTIDRAERLVCGVGYLYKIRDAAEQLGYAVRYAICHYDEMRPDACEPDWENLGRRFSPRHRQDECLAAMEAWQCGRIDAGAGFGKSMIFAATGLLYPKARIVAVAKSAAVVQTIRNHALKLFPDVGQVGDGHDRVERFTVYTADSLVARRESVDCDILLGDEIHQLCTPGYIEALSVAGRFARRYGGTANMEDRFDGAHAELEGIFGPVIFRIPYEECVANGLIVPIEVRWHDVVLPRNPAADYKMDHKRKEYGIWRNDERNDLIAKLASEYPEDVQVLILVDKVVHAAELGRRLPASRLCYRELDEEREADVFREGAIDRSRIFTSSRERQELQQEFEGGKPGVYIATGTWQQGVSSDSVSVVFRVDGCRSTIMATQIPGRVCRIHEASGKAVGIVHDFCDQFDEGYRLAAKDRQHDYARIGFRQVRAKDGVEIRIKSRKKKTT